jgi:hypothetical protein
MTHDEAKFILSGCRPNGEDGRDPRLAEALAQARQDPALQTWLAHSQAFDAQVAAKLRVVEAPRDLRDKILAGSRASRPRPSRPARSPRRFPWWLRVAAVVAVLATIGIQQYYHQQAVPVGLQSFGQFALADLGVKGHIGDPDTVMAAALSASDDPIDHGALPVDLARMESDGCRTLRYAGLRVFEVCFHRGQISYHLYILPRTGKAAALPHDRFDQFGKGGSTAVWSDAQYVFAVTTKAGLDELRKVL